MGIVATLDAGDLPVLGSLWVMALPFRRVRTRIDQCTAIANGVVDGSSMAKSFADQLRALGGGRGLRDFDAGFEKDAEVEFPSYGRASFPERIGRVDMLSSPVCGKSRNDT